MVGRVRKQTLDYVVDNYTPKLETTAVVHEATRPAVRSLRHWLAFDPAPSASGRCSSLFPRHAE
jgi:hypothetical protein